MSTNSDNLATNSQKLVQEGLFVMSTPDSSQPHLIGNKCQNCGEIIFPKQTGCPNCCSDRVEEVLFGEKGNIYSFTVVCYPVTTGYLGPVPYGIGMIDLPEGPRIVALLKESDPQKLKAGMEVELSVEKLFTDKEGNDVIGFIYKPV